jgi:NAD-dependent DNA ligase
MEAPEQKFSRLLGALDELVGQETATLAQREFSAIDVIQRRTEPLVAALVALGPSAADESARAKVAGLLARRQHNIEFIETQLATARDELISIQESTQRVARIAPVYGRAEGSQPTTVSLNVAG